MLKITKMISPGTRGRGAVFSWTYDARMADEFNSTWYGDLPFQEVGIDKSARFVHYVQ